MPAAPVVKVLTKISVSPAIIKLTTSIIAYLSAYLVNNTNMVAIKTSHVTHAMRPAINALGHK